MAKVTFEEEANSARQHRISRRRGEKRSHEDLSDDSSDTSGNRTIPLSAIKGIKKQARYEPVIPMSKAELTKWRKEARRVRNRESAAASRRKTRERIEELEGQVETLEHKYCAALKRIAELEETKKITPSAVSPPLSPKPQQQQVVPSWSLGHQDAASALAKSAEYETILSAPTIVQEPSLQQQHHHQQPNLMISRPTAVCVN